MAIEESVINDEELLDKLSHARESLLREIRKAIIGQDDVVEQVLLSLFVGGHSIITGVPGLAKTLLVRTVASVLDLSFKRIQFTPDLCRQISLSDHRRIGYGSSRDAIHSRAAVQHCAGRRNQCRPQDPGRLARSHAGRPGNGAGINL
jgi:hypothetical protein